MPRTRRSVLAGGVALTAGCLGTPVETTPDHGTERPTRTATGTSTSSGGAATIERVDVRPEFVARDTPDSVGTYGDRDEQFVVAVIDADGPDAPATAAFALTVGDETFAPDGDVGGMGGRLWDYGAPYAEETPGWVAFSVPKPVDGAATLTWPGGRHALGDQARARLGRPPTDFELRAFDVPERVRPGEEARAEVTVENVGEADGVFVGAFNRSGPYVAYTPEAAVALPVPAGETATWEYTNTPDDRYGDGERGAMRLRLRWRDGRASRTVTVGPETGDLPADLERVTTPPYEIGEGACDPPETDRDPLYLCANMPAEPSLPFGQATTTGVVLDGEGIATSDDRTTPQFYAALLTDEGDRDRVAGGRGNDAVELVRGAAFDSQSVLVVQTGWGSGSEPPHLQRIEGTDRGVRAYGCGRRPCGVTDDLTVRTTVARFDDPDPLDAGVVTLTTSPERRVTVAAREGVVAVGE